jgi:PEP-CTERM motif
MSRNISYIVSPLFLRDGTGAAPRDTSITLNGGVDTGSPDGEPFLAGVTLATGASPAVPEPSTWAMMLLGFAGLGFLSWRGSRNAVAHSA